LNTSLDAATRRPADEAGVDDAAARAKRPLLGRLGVGAKLMLLVLLPVGVLLGFTIAASVDNWRTALSLRDFQNATEQSPPPSPTSARSPHL
jgi:hypothetical protein